MMRCPRLHGLSLALVSVVVVSYAGAPLNAGPTEAYNLFFRETAVTTSSGRQIELTVSLQNNPEAATGFSFGVQHDPAVMTFDEAVAASALASAVTSCPDGEPDSQFFFVGTTSGSDGVIVAAVLNFDPAVCTSPERIAPGDDNPVITLRYTVAEDAAAGTSDVSITAGLGEPPMEVIVVAEGASKGPTDPESQTTATVSIEIATDAIFRRGDVDQTGGSLNVADGIVILNFLFAGGSPTGAATRANCKAVYNFDGSTDAGIPGQEDEADIRLADAIAVFSFLFDSGASPALPYPGCAVNPTPAAEDMMCREFTACN